MKRSLFKYFKERRYANDFLEGKLLFRSLAHFRDDEDAAREDQYEGTSNFRPEGGLQIHNQTQGVQFGLPMAFESSVKAGEIFVYCVSQTLSAAIAREFEPVARVEITKIATLCGRIQSALPSTATFKARKVDYYSESQGGNPRWALPWRKWRRARARGGLRPASDWWGRRTARTAFPRSGLGRQSAQFVAHEPLSYLAKVSRNPVEINRSLRWRPCTGLLRRRSLAVTCQPSHFIRTVLLPMSKLTR